MATQSKETLKTYFETGDKPTQQQFEDLIDSLNTPFIGEIKTVSFPSVPNGWAKCDGQLLNISEHTTLFNLIGTIYGGDGTTTFALPNLQGKTMIHNDSSYSLGQAGGKKENTLTENQLPAHTHDIGNLEITHNLTGTVLANEEDGESNDPQLQNFSIATGGSSDPMLYNSMTNDKTMAANNVLVNGTISFSGTITNTGNAVPVNNMSPYLVVNTIIALEGRNPLTN
ncbi:microcystin-dependent protein [Kordia periserrulae]|uniref:Microcystin-dependent protein n=1 Tax=Kordia periserrulae TaxID=701523 RepID=A0A2T6C201_9FLAO|nr:tail fiber protein [Kordia periserrulae]PTX62354.1 microcystin-dependent protein [Kordia periserrulae]